MLVRARETYGRLSFYQKSSKWCRDSFETKVGTRKLATSLSCFVRARGQITLVTRHATCGKNSTQSENIIIVHNGLLV